MPNRTRDQNTWGELPFKLYLSFKVMFDYWDEMANSSQKGKSLYAKEVLSELAPYPILREMITDFSVLDTYESQIQLLLSPLFPEPLKHNEIKSSALPFTNITFNHSTRFKKILDEARDDYILKVRDFDKDAMYTYACLFILNAHYRADFNYKRPYYFDIPNTVNGKDSLRHYRVFLNGDFAKISTVDPNFNLSEKDILEMKDNFGDIELWKKKIPPNSFKFEGFALMTIFDLTNDELLSGLKSNLLEPNALYSDELFSEIERKMGVIFNIPNLKFGYTLIDAEDGVFIDLDGNNNRSLIIKKGIKEDHGVGFCNVSRDQILNTKKPIILPDLENVSEEDNPYMIHLREQGISSYLMTPIRCHHKTIGVLELGAPHPRALSSVSTNKLEDLLPIFTVALQRGMNDYETRLEAIIQEKCTAIHPSVSWRFFDAAENYLRAEQRGEKAEMEDIVFEDIYPLFGQSDIKGSSTEQNRAIQEDLIKQLDLAKRVLRKAAGSQHMPIYQQLGHRINECRNGAKKGLSAGDEVNILEFLTADIYPVFKHLKTLNPEMKKLVEDYESHLDPELGVLYEKRKGYESSVTMINEKIAAFIDKAQEAAQDMFPHYFEKYKTDGVEYNMYIGDSLVKKQKFDPLYLQNLRLWQLETMCGVEQMMHELKPTLEVPLEVASLILIHSSPMTIKFRMTEKRFDVDGAYNVRYEIIKKRIDKAYIKDRNERLTVPGKIAIVYSQNKDAVEYRAYLKYLKSQGLIKEEIEDLELEELQGASGLKALRVTLNYDYKKMKEEKLSKTVATKS